MDRKIDGQISTSSKQRDRYITDEFIGREID